MSETDNAATQPPAETTVPTPAAPPAVPQAPPADPWDHDGKGGKAAVLADLAKVREEAKSYKAEAEKIPTFETAIKGLETERDEAKTNAAKATSDYAKLMAAVSAGVSGEAAVEFASRLRGETPEELAADAAKLLGIVPAQIPQTGDPTQGARRAAPATLADKLAEAEAKGDFKAALSLKTQMLLDSQK